MKRIVLFIILLNPVLGMSQAELKIDALGTVSGPPVLTPAINQVSVSDVLVRNYAATFQFHDTLRINIGVVDSLGQMQQMDQFNGGKQDMVELGAGVDSVLLDTVVVDLNPSYFKEGNNTVVIWPAAPGNYTLDSVFLVIFYTHSVGYDDLVINDINIKMGPNPATEHLYLGDPDHVVQQVRIRGLDGQLIFTGSTNKMLYLGGLNNGIYLVELQTQEKIYTRKLVIQR